MHQHQNNLSDTMKNQSSTVPLKENENSSETKFKDMEYYDLTEKNST